MVTPLFPELPIKAVIFDCDGVLVDTEYLKFLAWEEALASKKIDFAIEEYMPLVGNSSKNILLILKQLKNIDIPEEVIELKNAKYRILQKQGVPPIKEMIAFARRFVEEKQLLGIKLGLASSAPTEEILQNLRQIGLENAFDLIISGSDGLDDYVDKEGKNKPKPYIYLHAMKKLGVFPAQCVVIEDSSTGVGSAVSAGCFTVAVPNAYTRNQDLSSAHMCLESFIDVNVHDFLQQIGELNDKINIKVTDIIPNAIQPSQGRQRRYIITGGPGSGKTSIINDLAKRGYLVAQEAATDVIEEGLQQNLEDPWMADDYHIKISSLMAKRQKEIGNSPKDIVFFDRGHLDGITYILLQRRKLPQQVVDYVQSTIDEGFFDKTVFFIENLGVCEQASNRTETLEEALAKSRQIKQNYLALGYEVIDIPPDTIEQRSESIIRHVQQHMMLRGPKLPLASQRLILRDFIQEDIPQVINIASHPRFSGYLRFHPEKISESVVSYIEEAIEMQKPDLITGHREVFRLAVCLKDTPSHVIGCCVFHGWNKSPDDNDQIGYFIHPEYQGCGYATEALGCLVAPYLFQYPERIVEAIVHPNNIASQKVLKKLGFSQVGEKEIDVHGRKEPRTIYILNAQKFTSQDNLAEQVR